MCLQAYVFQHGVTKSIMKTAASSVLSILLCGFVSCFDEIPITLSS